MSLAEAKTHAMRALLELRKRILSGEYEAGMRLLEVPTAEALEISRTPVREAMSRLVEEGLLERAASGGFMVRRFSFADVTDAIELRGVLEGCAARLAAERGVRAAAMDEIRDVVARLDRCFGKAIEDVDFDSYSELNASFHALLAGLAGSEMIRRELERAVQLPFASPSAFLFNTDLFAAFHKSLHIAQDQHRAMVEAIAAREGTRAEALAREHARIARHNLEYVLTKDRDLIRRVPGLALIVP
jgi:GntR family transcriptional regulator of vanillate catabolism